MSNNTININLVIADRTYPLKVLPQEEEGVRKAAKMLNERIKELQGQYAGKDKQDYLAMCGLMIAVENLSSKEKTVETDVSFIDKLDEIELILDEIGQ